MTQPTRPYINSTDAELQDLLVQSDQMQPPAAAHRLKADVTREINLRANNADAPDPTQNALVRDFLVTQAWAALSNEQQLLVSAHADAQEALAAATSALDAAALAAGMSQLRFEAAVTAVQDAATKAQTVVAALPADQQAALASVTDQVPALVEQVTTLSASASQVATDTFAAQSTLTAAGQQVSDAVTAAVAATTDTTPGLIR